MAYLKISYTEIVVLLASNSAALEISFSMASASCWLIISSFPSLPPEPFPKNQEDSPPRDLALSLTCLRF
jgi:hypothetical protein